MRKRFKGIKPKAKYIIPLVALVSLLGTSYGYWGDTLKIETNISTGNVKIEGVKGEYSENNPYVHPKHPENGCSDGVKCIFQDWWESSDSAENTPIDLKDVKIEKGYNEREKKPTYIGKATIVFTIENKGSVPTRVMLEDKGSVHKKNWLKLSAPNRSHKDDKDSNVTLSQVFSDGNTRLNITRESGQQETGVQSFEMVPEEVVEVSIDLGELEVFKKNGNIGYEPRELLLDKLRIEAQICLKYEDVHSGSWNGNTCNSLFVNRELKNQEIPGKPNSCETCSPWCECEEIQEGEDCDGLEDGEGDCDDCSKGCPCYEPEDSRLPALGGSIPTPLPAPIPQPDGPSDGEVLPLPRPIPLPELDGSSDGEILPLPDQTPQPDGPSDGEILPLPDKTLEPDGPSDGEVLPLPNPIPELDEPSDENVEVSDVITNEEPQGGENQ